jgi:hypothetical protein
MSHQFLFVHSCFSALREDGRPYSANCQLVKNYSAFTFVAGKNERVHFGASYVLLF